MRRLSGTEVDPTPSGSYQGPQLARQMYPPRTRVECTAVGSVEQLQRADNWAKHDLVVLETNRGAESAWGSGERAQDRWCH